MLWNMLGRFVGGWIVGNSWDMLITMFVSSLRFGIVMILVILIFMQ